jgi:DNA-directed RNA polymerase subunit RPC12/RpoP
MTKTNPALPPSIEDELKCPVCRARLSREDDEHPCDPDREQRESAIRADERLKEALGIDPDGQRVKCGDCEQWTPLDDAVAIDAEETVRCPTCVSIRADEREKAIAEFVRLMREQIHGGGAINNALQATVYRKLKAVAEEMAKEAKR